MKTLQLTPKYHDDWSRMVYKGDDGQSYVDVDGTPHTMTDWGEPIEPIVTPYTIVDVVTPETTPQSLEKFNVTLFYRDGGNYKFTGDFVISADRVIQAIEKLGSLFYDQEDAHVQYDIDLGISRDTFNQVMGKVQTSDDHNYVIVEKFEPIINWSMDDEDHEDEPIVDQGVTLPEAAPFFPNGFTSWTETHHEMVLMIDGAISSTAVPTPHNRQLRGKIFERYEKEGRCGMWELAVELTNAFEAKYVGTPWGEDDPLVDDWVDAIDTFVCEFDKSGKITNSPVYRNYYKCYNDQCNHFWQGVDEGMPDDDCPKCGSRHCTPYNSIETDPGSPADLDESKRQLTETDILEAGIHPEWGFYFAWGDESPGFVTVGQYNGMTEAYEELGEAPYELVTRLKLREHCPYN